MIDWSKSTLREILRTEKKYYVVSNKDLWLRNFMCAERAQIWKFQKALRRAEYYKQKKGLIAKIKYVQNLKKKNKYGNKFGLSIHCDCFDVGLYICHLGNIVVNGDARIGKNCILHGCNCIGNTHNNNNEVPNVGDNVEFGWGASCFGRIEIASDVILGAQCVVVKSITASNSIWVGNPQRQIGTSDDKE